MLQSLNAKNVVHTLDQWLRSEAGFDQCGAMYGQITVDESDNRIERQTIEVNLPGVRRVRFGDANQIGTCGEQSTSVIGVGRDGTVFVLSNTSAEDSKEYIFFILISNTVFDC